MSARFSIALIALAFCISTHCSVLEGPEGVFNPMDPESPDFVLPSTVIELPSWGDTLNSEHITIRWKGNFIMGSGREMSFSHRLDQGTWSAWTTDQSTSYHYLDHGLHTFEILAHYPTGVVSNIPDTLPFFILKPEITFMPDSVIAALNDTISLELVVENVLHLVSAHLVLNAAGANVELVGVDAINGEDSFLRQNGSMVSLSLDTLGIGGDIQVSVSVQDGDPPWVSGSGAIVKLAFATKQTGESWIEISGWAYYIDHESKAIDFFLWGQARLEIQ